MKIPYHSQQRRRAFTIVEMLIAVLIVGIASGGIFLALNAGITLYAKNTSVNTAHSQMLRAVQRITKDVHAAVDTPELLNADLTPYTGTGSAAGVAVEVMWERPFTIQDYQGWSYFQSILSGSINVAIHTGSGPRPSPGQRIILPGLHAIDEIITAAIPYGPTWTALTMQNPAWKDIEGVSPNAPFVMAWITDRMAYVVVNGDLHFYTQQYTAGAVSWLDRGIRVRGVTSATPFSLTDWTYANAGLRISATGFNAADLFGIAYQSDTQTYWKLTATTPTWVQTDRVNGTRSVIGKLTVRDSTYSNRGFQAVDMPLTFKVPYRVKLKDF